MKDPCPYATCPYYEAVGGWIADMVEMQTFAEHSVLVCLSGFASVSCDLQWHPGHAGCPWTELRPCDYGRAALSKISGCDTEPTPVGLRLDLSMVMGDRVLHARSKSRFASQPGNI